MDTQTKVNISYTDFLKAIESPQFKNNSEKIYEYLSQTENTSWFRSRIIATCKRECLIVVWALQDLKFLKDIRTSRMISGKDYIIKDESLLNQIAAHVEADYLNKLLEIEKIYKRRRINPDKAEEIRKPISEIWKEESADEDMSLNVELHGSKRQEKFLLDWIESFVYALPYTVEIDKAGRPIPFDSINQQLQQLESVLSNAKKLLAGFQDGLVDEFIETLLNSRLPIDNRLYRDIYDVLLLYERLPQELVESHDNNEDKNPYVRENYIKQRVYRMIKQSPDLASCYKSVVKSTETK